MGRVRVAGRPTLQQVADEAAVSIATASRALSGGGQVAPATVTAVRQAAARLGYVVDGPARAPRRDTRVAVVVGTLAGAFIDPITETVAAVSGETVGCVVATTRDDPEREVAQLRLLLRDPGVSGVVVAGGRWTSAAQDRELAALVREYAALDKPLVFCGRPAIEPGVPEVAVDYDNSGGAAAAMAHLYSQGHTEVLFIRGPVGFSTSDARARGYEQARADLGLDLDPRLVRTGQRDRRTGVEAIRSALRDGVAFTAVFGECDLIAVGALAALGEAGIAVPEEVSVIGFDDISFAADLRVPLSTVHVPFREVGHTAARLAMAPDHANREAAMVAGTHLVVRGSVRPRVVSQDVKQR